MGGAGFLRERRFSRRVLDQEEEDLLPSFLFGIPGTVS